MNDKAFLDTNVLIYALASNDSRGQRAEQLLIDGGMVSVQVLDEFVVLARRKMRMSWEEVKDALHVIRIFCPGAVPITLDTHELGLGIAEKYGLRIYDALIVVSALETNCRTLYTEDLQDGLIVESRIEIRNPFV